MTRYSNCLTDLISASPLPRLAAPIGLFVISLATCLQAGIASALQFTFSLQGNYGSPTQRKTDVSGLIKGLQDNKNEQLSGISVIITSAMNSPPDGWPEFATIVAGKGFSVSGGVITDLDALFIKMVVYSRLDI